MTDNRWSVAATKMLISEYERYSMLYDIQHPDYKNRNKRLETYKHISDTLQENGHSYSIEDVKKKVNGLRSQYLMEKMKVSNSIKNRADGYDLYKPTVYWYSMLHFLEASGTPDESISNSDEPSSSHQIEHTEQTTKEMVESNECSNLSERDMISTNENSGEKYPSNKSNKRKSQNCGSLPSQVSKTMRDGNETAKKNELKNSVHCGLTDPIDTFAKFVADELRSIRTASSDLIMRQAKRKIQQVILQTWDAIDSSSPTSSHYLSSSKGLPSIYQLPNQPETMFRVIPDVQSYNIIRRALHNSQMLSPGDNMSDDFQDPPNPDTSSDNSEAS